MAHITSRLHLGGKSPKRARKASSVEDTFTPRAVGQVGGENTDADVEDTLTSNPLFHLSTGFDSDDDAHAADAVMRGAGIEAQLAQSDMGRSSARKGKGKGKGQETTPKKKTSTEKGKDKDKDKEKGKAPNIVGALKLMGASQHDKEQEDGDTRERGASSGDTTPVFEEEERSPTNKGKGKKKKKKKKKKKEKKKEREEEWVI